MKRAFAAFVFAALVFALSSGSTLASVFPIELSYDPTPDIKVSDTTNPVIIYTFQFSQNLPIEYFKLFLDFNGINNGNQEWYWVPTSDSPTKDYALTASGQDQSFFFDKTTLGSFFDTFVSGGYFSLGFFENTTKIDDFTLESATLTIYGTPTPTPIPGAALLLGSGLLGLIGLRRRLGSAPQRI